MPTIFRIMQAVAIYVNVPFHSIDAACRTHPISAGSCQYEQQEIKVV